MSAGSKGITEKLSEMKTNISSSVTSGDLAFDLTEKNDRSSFLLILTALSNAACRLSLRRSGVELDGGRKTAPPPRHAVLQMEHRLGAG